MFALMPFVENFRPLHSFSAHWKTIWMKYHIALLWLSSLVNSSTQEVDEHTPVTTNTEKHGAKGRRSQQSKTLFFWFSGKCGNMIALAQSPCDGMSTNPELDSALKQPSFYLSIRVRLKSRFKQYKIWIQSRWEGDFCMRNVWRRKVVFKWWWCVCV